MNRFFSVFIIIGIAISSFITSCSNPSAETPSLDTTPPAEIVSFTVTAVGESSVRLNWEEPHDQDYKSARIYFNDVVYKEVPKGTMSLEISGLAQDSDYSFSASAVDSSGNESQRVTESISLTTPLWDQEINGLTITQNGSDAVTLKWGIPAESSISLINIYSEGILLASVDHTTLEKSLKGFQAGRNYQFTVKTEDSRGMESPGTSISISLSGSSSSSSEIENLTNRMIDQTTVELQWSSPSGGVEKILVYCNGSLIRSLDAAIERVVLERLDLSKEYSFIVKTLNSENIESEGVGLSLRIPDITAPYEVGNFHGTQSTNQSITLQWTEPSDSDFSAVRLYQDSILIQEIPKGTTSLDIGSLNFGEEYLFKIETLDASGNVSNGTELNRIIASPDSFFTTELYNGRISIKKYTGNESQVIIPARIQGYPVAGILEYAFQSKTSIQSITIPKDVVSVESKIFQGCTSLAEIVITPENSNFVIHEGALHTADKTRLISYPSARTGSAFNFAAETQSVDPYAFYQCRNLSTVSINSNLQSIEEYAFNSSSLSEITIPGSVTELGPYSFAASRNLVTVNFEEGLQTIGDYAFNGCYRISQLSIPSSTSYIGIQSFVGCSGLRQLEIGSLSIPSANPQGIIEEKAFYNLDTTSIIIGNSIREIRTSAFDYNDNLNSLSLGSGLEIIGFAAFSNCRVLQSVTLPDSVKRLENNSFNYCMTLTTFNIGSGLEYIGNNVFNRTRITSLNLPTGLKYIEQGAFNSMQHLQSLVIPDTVEYIGQQAFQDCTALTSIQFPTSLKVLEEQTMRRCTSLTSVTLPQDLEVLPENFFAECSSLTSITLPDSMKRIENYAFNGCSSLSTVVFPAGLEALGISVFNNCTSLPSLTIPDSVTEIGKDLLKGCSSLTSITLPTGITQLPQGLFYGCTSLETYIVPSTVTSIVGNTFYDCTSLREVTLPDNLSAISSGMFYNCSALTTVNVPSQLTYIGDSAFYGCRLLVSFPFPAGLTGIGSRAFFGCSALSDAIVIPEAMTSIGQETFKGCSSIPTVSFIGANLSDISREAFSNCTSITEVTLPESIYYIREYAFWGCTSLATITVLAETPPRTYSSCFGNHAAGRIFKVPGSVVNDYKDSSFWSSYSTSIESL